MESPQKKSTIEEFLCSAELRGQVYSHLIILSVLHSFVFITGVLGNTLILIALYNESSLHPPSIVLYCNLAIADLHIGIIAVPLVVLRFTAISDEGEVDYLSPSVSLKFYH